MGDSQDTHYLYIYDTAMPEALEIFEGSNVGCSRYALFVYIYGIAMPHASQRYEVSNG